MQSEDGSSSLSWGRAWLRGLPRLRTLSATRSVIARRRPQRGRGLTGEARRGSGEIRVQAGTRLLAVAASGDRCARVIAGAGFLQDEPPARADLAQDPPRDLLQRRRDGRILRPRPGDRDLGGRRGIGTAFYAIDQYPRRSRSSSVRPSRACSATARRPTRDFPDTSSDRSSWTARAIPYSPAGRSAPITPARSPSAGAAGT